MQKTKQKLDQYQNNSGEMIIYESADGALNIEVRVLGETVKE
jgi:hypothetical protein